MADKKQSYVKICPFQTSKKDQLSLCVRESCTLYDEIFKTCSVRVIAISLYRIVKVLKGGEENAKDNKVRQ